MDFTVRFTELALNEEAILASSKVACSYIDHSLIKPSMIERTSQPNIDRSDDQLSELRISLTDSLARADLLGMNLVAIKVCEALDLLEKSSEPQ